jgi:hypothetical protein
MMLLPVHPPGVRHGWHRKGGAVLLSYYPNPSVERTSVDGHPWTGRYVPFLHTPSKTYKGRPLPSDLPSFCFITDVRRPILVRQTSAGSYATWQGAAKVQRLRPARLAA